jgi:hypothetical protein
MGCGSVQKEVYVRREGLYSTLLVFRPSAVDARWSDRWFAAWYSTRRGTWNVWGLYLVVYRAMSTSRGVRSRHPCSLRTQQNRNWFEVTGRPDNKTVEPGRWRAEGGA